MERSFTVVDASHLNFEIWCHNIVQLWVSDVHMTELQLWGKFTSLSGLSILLEVILVLKFILCLTP